MGVNFFFRNFTEGLIEKYPELFDAINGNTTQHQINFGKKWKNYASVIALSNNDIRAIRDVVLLPLEECLLFLAYQSDYNHLQNLIHKEAMKKNGF